MKNQKRNLVISTMFQQAGHATGIALGWGLGIALITYLPAWINYFTQP